jgi:hypothetical protein
MSTNLSYVAYTADGVQTQYDLTFGYLSRSHVFVFVDGVLSSYRWVSGTRVQLNLAPDPGQTVKIQRLTDRVNRIVDFQDGTTLLSGDLNASDLQNFYILQEIADQVADGVLTGAIPVATASGSANGGFVTEQWINEQLESNAYTTQAYTQLLQQITDEEVARAQAIVDEAQARTDAIAAASLAEATQRAQDVLALEQADIGLGDRLTTLETTVDTPTTGLSAKVATLESTAVDLENNKAEASVVTAIQSDLDDPTTGLKARATSLEDRTTAVENNKAEAADLDLLDSQVNDPVTGLDARATSLESRTTAVENGKAEVSDLNALDARVGTAEGNISSLDTAIANETGVRVSQINAANARIDGVETDVTNVTQQLATETQARIDDVEQLTARYDVGAQASPNFVHDPRFRDTATWAAGWDGNHGLPTAWGFDHGWTEVHPAYKVAFKTVSGTPADETVAEVPEPLSDYRVPVKAGEMYYCSIFVAAHRAKAVDMLVKFWDSSMAWVGAFYSDRETSPKSGAASDLKNFTRCGLFWIPDRDGYAAVSGRMIHNGTQADPYLWAAIPSIQPVANNDYTIPPVDVVGAEAERGLKDAASAQADATSALSLVATEQASRISEVSRLDVQFRSDVNSQNLVKNSKFSMDPEGYVGLPRGWVDWANGGQTEIRQSAFDADRLVAYMDSPAGEANRGFLGGISDVVPGQAYTLTATVRRRGGSFTASGVHTTFRNSDNVNLAVNNLDFDGEASLDGQTGAYKDGTVTFSKTIIAPAGTTALLVYVMAAWTGFGSNATGAQIDWYEVSVTPVDASVQTGIDAKATADSNTQLIASETAARASALDSLEAQYRSELPRNNLIPGPYRIPVQSDWENDSKFARRFNVNFAGTGGINPWTNTPAFKFVTTTGDGRVALTPDTGGGYFVLDDRAGVMLDSARTYAFRFDHAIDVNAASVTLFARGNQDGAIYTVGNWSTSGGRQNDTSSWSPSVTQEYSFEIRVSSASGVPDCWVYRLQLVQMFSGENHADIPWVEDDPSDFSLAQVNILKDALATGSSSQARLFLGVNTANNEAFLEAYAGEGDGVWNGSKIKFTADKFEFNGDVIVNGTITADNLAANAVSNHEVFENSASLSMSTGTWVDAATLTFESVGIGVELRGSAVVTGSGFGAGPGTFQWRVLRGATVIKGPFDIPAVEEVTDFGSGVFQYSKTANFVADTNDIPSSGTYTYKLQVYLTGNGGSSPSQSVSQRYLSAREFKR